MTSVPADRLRSEEAGMSFWKPLVFPLAMATSLFVGPVVMTAALVGYHWVVARPLLSDGQYALFLIITVPSGAAAALAACAALGGIKRNRNKSGLICFLGGFLTLAPALLYDGAVALNASANGQWSTRAFFEGLLELLPVIAAGLALIVAGLVIRRNPSQE